MLNLIKKGSANMSQETVKMKGEWFIKVYGPEGDLKDTRQGFNVVTTVGKEFLASFYSLLLLLLLLLQGDILQ